MVVQLTRLLIPLYVSNVVDGGSPHDVSVQLFNFIAFLCGYRCLVVIKFAIMIEVDHLVAIVASRQVHYAIMLGPVGAYGLVARSQGVELILRDHWVPLRHVVLVVHH